ncbi:unnamed protein product [Haemonchus placei]|uniref:Uncharacterized protein n=1 Tax=Haemonchus placei TaxID=6290 RepID=A0A0N4WIJ9_HAEPC|nr:unnamed protein product [Haemonchus placei]
MFLSELASIRRLQNVNENCLRLLELFPRSPSFQTDTHTHRSTRAFRYYALNLCNIR